MVGLHRAVTLSFMLVGHSKFSPDWCYGLLKQQYWRTYVSSLQDIVRVATESADVNEVQLVGTDRTRDSAGSSTTWQASSVGDSTRCQG